MTTPARTSSSPDRPKWRKRDKVAVVAFSALAVGSVVGALHGGVLPGPLEGGSVSVSVDDDDDARTGCTDGKTRTHAGCRPIPKGYIGQLRPVYN